MQRESVQVKIDAEGAQRLDVLRLSELRAQNVARVPHFGHSLQSWTALEWAGAMCGEAGEAANVAKKIRRRADGCEVNVSDFSNEELVDMLANELADVVIYADLLAAREGIDLGAAVRRKFNEVSERVGANLFLHEVGAA